MVQKQMKLNSNKAKKGGKAKAPVVSKVDILKRAKKRELAGQLGGATTRARKQTVRCEENLAAKTQVEGGGNSGGLTLIKVNAQTLARAKNNTGKQQHKSTKH
mmetsp:Transcript_50901/g.131231  ORF Transcript_50901/g.131231 Transcript_50901/m.131231 type:complete len:103 (+) Transcript_50901:54-362(+)